MRPTQLFLLVWSLSASASGFQEKRQADSDAQFSSAAGQLVSLYIPPSAASAIYSAAAAASVSGSPAAVIEAALTDSATPAWLTAVPSAYQPNIQSLDYAIDDLRGQASAGSISGAPIVVSSIDESGHTDLTTIMPVGSTVPTPSGMTITGGVSGSGSATATASPSGVPSVSESSTVAGGSTNVPTTTLPKSVSIFSVPSSAGTTTSSGSSAPSLTTLTGSNSQSSSATSASGASASSSSSSTGMACATQVPGMAIGVLGILGAVVAL